jgi:hypothetical protein
MILWRDDWKPELWSQNQTSIAEQRHRYHVPATTDRNERVANVSISTFSWQRNFYGYEVAYIRSGADSSRLMGDYWTGLWLWLVRLRTLTQSESEELMESEWVALVMVITIMSITKEALYFETQRVNSIQFNSIQFGWSKSSSLQKGTEHQV